MRETDGHRKRDCLSTVASDEIRRTDMWRQRDREREIERERARDRVKERKRKRGRECERVDQLSLYSTVAPGLASVN